MKLWCLPFKHDFSNFPELRRFSVFKSVRKKSHRNTIYISKTTTPFDEYCDKSLAHQTMKKALSMRKIAEECGMEAMVQEVRQW